jgi:hypothetical protein
MLAYDRLPQLCGFNWLHKMQIDAGQADVDHGKVRGSGKRQMTALGVNRCAS